jgi:YVTN family beta-propeller protein
MIHRIASDCCKKASGIHVTDAGLKTSRPTGSRLASLSAVLSAAFLCAAAGADVHSALDTAFSPDGKTLAVTDATAAALVLMDPVTRKVQRTVKLAGPVSGLAWATDGKRLYAAESGTFRIAEIDAAAGSVARKFNTGRFPRGLAVASRRNQLLVTDWGLDQLTVIDIATGETRARIPVGRQPTSLAVSRDESCALVTNLIPATAATAADHAAEVSVIDLESMKARPAIRLPLGATNARGIAISGDGRTAYVAHALGRFNLPTTQLDRGWVNTNAVSIIDLPAGKVSATVLLDQMMDGAADPWGIALDPSGMRLFVTLSGVHQIAVIDLERLPDLLGNSPGALINDLAALHRHKMIRRIDLPARGPRGIDISPDGKMLAVAGYFSGNVVLLDHDAASPASIPLGPQAEPDPVRKGEMLFHDADRCYQRWLSCATCHPDARADGLNWDLLNDGLGNSKNTRSMVFSDRTPPVMSLGIRASMEVAARAGFVHILFTEPKEEELEAVIAYLKSLEPAISPHRGPDGGLTESAKRGERIFNSPDVGCSACHPGPLFTDLAMGDVGTGGTLDRGANRFDTPSLVELWRTPPYLHDGSATSLREVLADRNRGDEHGSTSGLGSADIDDLVAYLLSL